MKIKNYIMKIINYRMYHIIYDMINDQLKIFNEKNIEIDKGKNETKFINELKKIYKSNTDVSELKSRLILLKNLEINSQVLSFSSYVVSLMTISITIIGLYITVYNNVSGLGKYLNEHLKNNAGIIDGLKIDEDIYSYIINMFPKTYLFFAVIIILLILLDSFYFYRRKYKLIAINIHKSIVEEKLKEIESLEEQKKKQEYIEELRKVLIESKSDSNLVKTACDKIINKMFRNLGL